MKTSDSIHLRRQNAELRARLEEAEDTLRAIRFGEVDALVMDKQIYSLTGAETPYRIIFEAMVEGAAALGADGTLLIANQRLAEIIGHPLTHLLGHPFTEFVPAADRPALGDLFRRAPAGFARAEISLTGPAAGIVPVLLACNAMPAPQQGLLCLVVTDLTERNRAEQALREQMQELARFNSVAVGRELRMIELKAEVNHLARRLGQPDPYDVAALAPTREKAS